MSLNVCPFPLLIASSLYRQLTLEEIYAALIGPCSKAKYKNNKQFRDTAIALAWPFGPVSRFPNTLEITSGQCQDSLTHSRLPLISARS